MSFSAITIASCFDHKLPTFNYALFVYHQSHVSSYTVKSTKPPPLLIHRNRKHWDGVGDSALNGLTSKLKSSYLPTVETPFLLETEEDVVRANALYLCHPIQLALEKRCQNRIFCCSEVTTSVLNSKLRVDMLWYYEASNGSRTPFAVFEMKSPGTLDKNQFELCGIDEKGKRESDEDWAERFGNALDEVRETADNTMLTGNALIVTQQTGAYASHFFTPYTACFDWQALVLLEFPSADVGSCGDTVYSCFIKNDSNSAHIRKSLFGFLCTAFQSQGGVLVKSKSK